ncbi:MAG: hypothetical protein HXY26_10770 [Hydrogenophilaceae bacterium]|nr:hypothetical protein [Hydrogenophilaceae bacterium]
MALSQHSTYPSAQAQTAPYRWASRGLLTAWLLYSAIALGWFLANDPLLSLYVCGVR